MQHLIGEEKERTLVRAVLSLFLLVTKRLYGKEWEWSIGQIKTCRKKQHVEIDDRKEMPDLFCGKAAVGGNYNLMRDKKMADTLKLWDMFKDGKYDVYLSTVTLEEVSDCPEPKRSKMYDYLEQIEYTPIEITDDMSDIAQQIIDMGILTKKSYDDCQHIAAAVIYGCDCIISWNFKHIVNIKTIRGVRAITNLKGYKYIEILNPSVLLESEG